MSLTLYLKKQEDRRIKAGHLWVYSNEIDIKKSPLDTFKKGDLVTLRNAAGDGLGVGYINPHTLLSFRLLSKNPKETIDMRFFMDRIQAALNLRQQLYAKPFYRLVYGESDFLPGLVIDRLGDTFVMQITTAGMEQFVELITQALTEMFQPKAIILKNDSSSRALEGLQNEVRALTGELSESILLEENGIAFKVALSSSQKTGWYFDQRDNRAYTKPLVFNKRVLDAYSYVGGFGIAAAHFGAREVMCIDSSKTATHLVLENAALNHLEEKVAVMTEDVFDALKKLRDDKQKFDVVMVDPPAFIKKRKDAKEGFIAYQRLNELAMQLLTEDGILVSSSCSMHLSQEQLVDVIRRAGLKQNRLTQIIAQGFQGADHPVHPAIPETLYLKTLFCRVLATN